MATTTKTKSYDKNGNYTVTETHIHSDGSGHWTSVTKEPHLVIDKVLSTGNGKFGPPPPKKNNNQG